jgi:glycosyltransferase involved in cell wall biosynthesis
MVDGMSEKCRVVIVSGSYPAMRCGVAGHVALIAEATAQAGGYGVEVLTSDDPAVKIEPGLGYRVHPTIRSWGFFEAGAIVEAICELSPDVVHIQNPTVKYAGWRSAVMSRVGPLLKRRRPEVRLVVMQHDAALSRPIFRGRFGPLLRCADAVTVSNSRDQQAAEDLGVEAEKIYRTPVSSHFPILRSSQVDRGVLRAKLGIPAGTVCVAYFGFVHPGRNVDVLVKALGNLHERGRDIFGLMLGGPSAGAQRYYGRCRELSQKLGIGERILWTGYAAGETVAEGLAAADVFVSLPERGADLRNTSILAGLLAELPVITTENPHYYTDEELRRLGCFYVPARDAEALAESVLLAVSDPPPAEFRARTADELAPEKVWRRHVEMNLRAYQGQKQG